MGKLDGVDNPGKVNQRQGQKKQIIGFIITMAVVIIVVFSAMAGSVFMAGASLLSGEIFPEGTSVDGIDLGGSSYMEGYEVVAQKRRRELESVLIRLDYAGNRVEFTADELGLSYNIDAAMSGAYYLLPDGYDFMDTVVNNIETVIRPKPAAERSTVLAYDPSAIRKKVEAAVRPFDTEPVNAEIKVAFNKEGAVFAYTDEIPGRRARADEAADAVLQYLTGGASPVIDVPYDVLEADVTVAKLSANSVLVSEFTTVLNDNENRNINIELMCEAVGGTVISPGETLSINALAGRRTEKKGYKPAPAIVDGNIEDEIGGGICQLSGTLYNAALLADMEIVERKRHTYPSEYLPIGLDSTLNWDDKDLKIKNTTDYPVYVSANPDIENMTVTVKLYGKPLPSGQSIEIHPQVVREIKPVGRTILFKSSLPPGERKTVQKAVNGYEVKVFRNYYLEGDLVNSELISHDSYNTREAVVWIGADEEIK